MVEEALNAVLCNESILSDEKWNGYKKFFYMPKTHPKKKRWLFVYYVYVLGGTVILQGALLLYSSWVPGPWRFGYSLCGVSHVLHVGFSCSGLDTLNCP